MPGNNSARFGVAWAVPRFTKLFRAASIHINCDVFLQFMNEQLSNRWPTVAYGPYNQFVLADGKIMLLEVDEWNFLVSSIRKPKLGICPIRKGQVEHAFKTRCIGGSYRTLH